MQFRGNWHVLYHRMFDNGTTSLPNGAGSGTSQGAEGCWSGGHGASLAVLPSRPASGPSRQSGSSAAFSKDGIKWSPISRAYNTTVPLEDGSEVTFVSRERPKLVNGANGRPAYLSNAVQPKQAAGPDSGVTHTLVVPLNV